MFWFQLVVVALVVFAVAAVATGRGGSMGDAYPDRPDLRLPRDRPIEKDDIDRLRFSVGLRGYRMQEVDQVLDRLADELGARDARIRELTEVYHAAYQQGSSDYQGSSEYQPSSDYRRAPGGES